AIDQAPGVYEDAARGLGLGDRVRREEDRGDQSEHCGKELERSAVARVHPAGPLEWKTALRVAPVGGRALPQGSRSLTSSPARTSISDRSGQLSWSRASASPRQRSSTLPAGTCSTRAATDESCWSSTFHCTSPRDQSRTYSGQSSSRPMR